MDSTDPVVGLRAAQLLLSYAYGTPRQRIDLKAELEHGAILLRWGSTEPGDPAPAALPAPAADSDR